MKATPSQMFDERVMAIIGHQLPSDLPPDARLSEYGLDGGCVLTCEVCPHTYPPQLDDEMAKWETFRHVMASCTWHRLRAITLGGNGCTTLVTPYRAHRNSCWIPPDLDLTRIGLDYERCQRIHDQLVHGNGHGSEPICRSFPLLLLTMCRTSRQVINLAHGRTTHPHLITPEVLPARVA